MNSKLAMVLLAAVVASWASWKFIFSFDAKFGAACESVLSDRLKSPSSYKRISFERSEEELTEMEFVKKEEAEMADENSPNVLKFKKQQMEIRAKGVAAGTVRPKIFVADIEYDASNSFGTPLRSYARCEFYSGDGSTDFYAHEIKVDGLSSTDFLIKGIEAARQDSQGVN
jgi:hypothetical protein